MTLYVGVLPHTLFALLTCTKPQPPSDYRAKHSMKVEEKTPRINKDKKKEKSTHRRCKYTKSHESSYWLLKSIC